MKLFKFEPPADKSLTHRAFMLSLLAKRTSNISSALISSDTLATLKAIENLGAKIKQTNNSFEITGTGKVFNQTKEINCQNSGTTMRLISGLMCFQKFDSTLFGDESLNQRPMGRIIKPLRSMGANITSNQEVPPIYIQRSPSQLQGIEYSLPMASAQVKSAILLAGLGSIGKIKLTGKLSGRDHTEKIFKYLGLDINFSMQSIQMNGNQDIPEFNLKIANDPSSAAFWATYTLLKNKNEFLLQNLTLNPTRTGFFKQLEKMGAKVSYNLKEKTYEQIGDIKITPSNLNSITVEPNEVASFVDEVPLLCILATQADGKSIIKGLGELRYKESDRLSLIYQNLKNLGASIELIGDDLIISGKTKLSTNKIQTNKDHRLIMAMSILSKALDINLDIGHKEHAAVSYPGFWNQLKETQ